ncbi:MAG TPA: redoxin domain-containing protein [Candidatus Binataceae bacterium]|nr:redoxin domain-containing protein [Candidatus Binataceae bacterium]
METAKKKELFYGVVSKMRKGGADIGKDEWREFVNAQNDELRTGPEIGSKVPDFTLPDQDGRLWSLKELMGPAGLLLVFSRSADWCPYCRNQLADLQNSLAQLKEHGVNAASITYDSQQILSGFADANHVEYPMLSDAGSRVIRAFGILNHNVPEGHPMMFGMPFPGDYLIAPDGTVRDKLFLPSYEHRASASQVLSRHFGERGANSAEIKAGVVDATVSLSIDRCFPGQELGLSLDVRIAPGWHVYGKPLPSNYQAIELKLESPLIDEQSLEFPAPAPVVLKALGETLSVYSQELKANGKVRIRWSPPVPAPFLEGLGEKLNPGRYQIAGTLRFQTCSDEICEPPRTITFELPLTIEPGAKPKL